MRVNLDATGHVRAAAHVRDIGDAAANPQPFFRAAARILMRAVRDRFTVNDWAPLDVDTIRRKTRSGMLPGTLRARGKLERALTFWGAPGQLLTIEADELRFGIDQQGDAFYGYFHETGRGVPQRQMLRPVARSRSVRRKLQDALRNHLLGRRV